MLPFVTPQLVGNAGVYAVKRASAEPDRDASARADLRRLPWSERRERLDSLAGAFEPPLELSPVIEPSVALGPEREAWRFDRR